MFQLNRIKQRRKKYVNKNKRYEISRRDEWAGYIHAGTLVPVKYYIIFSFAFVEKA